MADVLVSTTAVLHVEPNGTVVKSNDSFPDELSRISSGLTRKDTHYRAEMRKAQDKGIFTEVRTEFCFIICD